MATQPQKNKRRSSKTVNHRDFDGRHNFASDNEVEQMLNDHFARFNVSKMEICKNFQIYTRRIFLKRFLMFYEFYRMTINLPGDIVELGVYRGASLMAWANFLEIRNMGDRQKQVFGFDNFAGFTKPHAKDGKDDASVTKVAHGFDSSDFEAMLEDAISIFDADRFIPYKPRIQLIKGDIQKTVPEFVKNTPGLRICLLHFDADMYEPTIVGLEHLWDLVVPGGVVMFDEYAIRPWEGETRAVDEFFKNKKVEIRKLDWCPNPGGYIIKGA